ncbi:MAG: hypothetical protein VBE63_13620 [Lamprobacter sp.]|nr:hypothetical protein [Lamprobacter sp.]MEA3640967.1 hypothetical protein [Lamprobacter sp.]
MPPSQPTPVRNRHGHHSNLRTAFEFANPANRNLSPVTADALVDTGAVHLCLPEHLAIQLDLKELEQREVTLANGHRIRVPYCGPVEIRYHIADVMACLPKCGHDG